MAEDSYYGYNAHSDVETLTKDNGDTRATYGYNAYGNDDKESFTGIDKPDAQQPGKEPFNFYRYNGKRFDPASGSYDMGFRDYNPGLNRFLTRDSYNGALSDMQLGSDPFTGNRYAFAGGNPITGIEADGHGLCADTECRYVCSATCSNEEANKLSDQMAADRQAEAQAQMEPRSGYAVPPVAPPALAPAPPGASLGSALGVAGSLVAIFFLASGDSAQDPRSNPEKVKQRERDCLSAPNSQVANIIYWNRDQHGRAMGAEACLRGRVQEMDESTYYTPPGWKPGMDRGHLIARMFGGDNTLPENFVPLYPDANQKTMRAIEDDVARRLNAGERLYYSVKPVYLFHTGDKMYIPQGVNIWVAGANGGRNYYVPNR